MKSDTILLEKLAHAKTETREAVAREAALLEFLSRVTWLANGESAYSDYCDGRAYRCISCRRTELEIGTEGHAENCEWVEARSLIKDISPAATALLEQLAKLEAQVADLYSLLQGIRTSLELASDLLAPPGPMAARAQGFIEEALEAVIEELD